MAMLCTQDHMPAPSSASARAVARLYRALLSYANKMGPGFSIKASPQGVKFNAISRLSVHLTYRIVHSTCFFWLTLSNVRSQRWTTFLFTCFLRGNHATPVFLNFFAKLCFVAGRPWATFAFTDTGPGAFLW